MKLGMVSVTFRNKDIPTVFEYAKRAGIDGIEWSVGENHILIGDAERTALVKKLSVENGIEIFSLASYCYMYDFIECVKTLETAREMSAPVLRIWAGRRGSDVCSAEEYDLIVENTVKMARLAKVHSITLAFEYHPNTLTDSADGAVELIQRINCDNVGLYWQVRPDISFEENRTAFLKISPYLLGNIHLSNYDEATGYRPLEEILPDLCGYFSDCDKDYNLMIEFVKDAAFSSLVADVGCVRKVLDK